MTLTVRLNPFADRVDIEIGSYLLQKSKINVHACDYGRTRAIMSQDTLYCIAKKAKYSVFLNIVNQSCTPSKRCKNPIIRQRVRDWTGTYPMSNKTLMQTCICDLLQHITTLIHSDSLDNSHHCKSYEYCI